MADDPLLDQLLLVNPVSGREPAASPAQEGGDDPLLGALTGSSGAAPASPASGAAPAPGWGRGAGLGVRSVVEGATALPGMVYDAVVTSPVNAAARAYRRGGAGAAIGSLARRLNPATALQEGVVPESERAPAEEGGTGGPPPPNPLRPAGDNVSALLDWLGVPKPATPTERVIDRVGREVAGAGSMMGAGRMFLGRAVPPSPAAPSNVPDVVARALVDAPRTQLGASAAAGAAGGLTAEAAPGNQLADMGASLATGVVAGMAPSVVRGVVQGGQAVGAPLTEAGRRRIVGSGIQQASSAPEGLAARLAASEERVPGSAPTAAEAAGDPGLLQVERSLRSGDPDQAGRFQARDAERDMARRAEMGRVGPGPENAQDVALAVQGRVAAEGSATREAEAAAIAAREAEAARLPPRLDPQTAGSRIRAPIQEEADAAALRTSRAFEDGVDPDGTSRLPMAPIKGVAEEVEGTYYGRLSGGPPRELRAVLDDIAAANDAESWRAMQNLRARLGGLLNGPLADDRLRAAVGRIRAQIDATAEDAAAPVLRPTQPVGMADLDRAAAAEGAAQRPDVREAIRAAAPAAPQGVFRLKSLISRLVELGGVQNQGGDMMYLMGGNTRPRPGLVSGRGMSLDQAAQRMVEEGYFPEFARRSSGDLRAGQTSALADHAAEGGITKRELLDAIDEELRGLRRRYPDSRSVEVERRAADHALVREVDRELSGQGLSLNDDADRVMRAVRPVDENAPRAGMDRPEPVFQVPEENRFTPAQAEGWREAIAAQTDEGRRFLGRPVKDVLRTQFGRYETPDSGVAQRFFHEGSGGPEHVRALIEAAGSRKEAVAALQGYAVDSLYRFAGTGEGGALVASRVKTWLDRHAGPLRAFPELRRRFGSVQQAAEQAEGVAAAGEKSRREIELGVARYFLRQDPQVAVRQVLRAGNAERAMYELRALVQNDPVAIRGLKRAYVDEWLRASESTATDMALTPRLSPAGSARFLRATKPAAEALFGSAELSRITAIADDFASGALVGGSRPAGSNTAQNLSTAYFLGRLTNGAVGLDSAATRFLNMKGVRMINVLRHVGADQVQRLLYDAMLDPQLAATLVREATPKNAEAAARAMTRIMDPDRFRQAAVDAAVRGTARAVNSGAQSKPRRERGYAAGGLVEDAAPAAKSGALDAAAARAVAPSAAQAKAGNYGKGHVRLHGLEVTIENARGSQRSGVGKDGKAWSVKLPAHYGYVKGTRGHDGDQVDVYLGPQAEDPGRPVFVIDQVDAQTGRFDEHKAMLGFADRAAAVKAYDAAFADGRGPQRRAGVTQMAMGEFRSWLDSGAAEKGPMDRGAVKRRAPQHRDREARP